MFDDVSTSSLKVSVAGLAARQTAIAKKYAKIATPGSLARMVKFV